MVEGPNDRTMEALFVHQTNEFCQLVCARTAYRTSGIIIFILYYNEGNRL